jgi:hypothetical protein
MNNYQNRKASALRLLSEIEATCHTYRELLTNAAVIRHEAYGEPFWSTELLRAYDALGRSLQYACMLAELRRD